jgi:hypothetical protein
MLSAMKRLSTTDEILRFAQDDTVGGSGGHKGDQDDKWTLWMTGGRLGVQDKGRLTFKGWLSVPTTPRATIKAHPSTSHSPRPYGKR